MKRKISQWPALFVRIPPEVFEKINEQAEARTLPASVIVREALGRTFGQDRAKAAL